MQEDPREIYRRAVERLLGTGGSAQDRILALAAGNGISRSDLLKRLKIRTDELDSFLGVMLSRDLIELDVERTAGRSRIIVRAKSK